LRFEDEQASHGRPVAIADVEEAVDGGAEKKGDGKAESVGDGVVCGVEFVAEVGEKHAHAKACGERWCGGFGGVMAEEVEGGEDEHLERAAGEDHGGAADGVVDALCEEARDDDEDGALLADPARGWAEVSEQGVVDRGEDGEDEDNPCGLCAQAAG